MKPKKSKNKEKPKISGAALATAMHKARIPARFVRPEVSLSTYAWGERMQKWIGAYLLPAHNDGKSLMIRGESADDMNACAMLTRSLVIRGNDAVMVTLPELLTMPDIRPSEYLVISGFFSSSYHNTHGRPMSAEKAYAYSWALWRIAEQGTTLVVFVDRGKTGEGAWWHEGLLSVFDRSISLNLSTTKTTV